MIMKRILMIANFCDFETKKGNNRFNYIANMLVDNGYYVELLTSSFSHKKKIQRTQGNDEKYDVTLIYEPGYNKNISLKRFYSHFIFGKNIKKYLINTDKKYDLVYCGVPSLTGPYLVGKYCKKNNIEFIIDVQDLWPEAFKMVFNPPFIGKIIYMPFNLLANKIYSFASKIIAVSKTYVDRAKKNNKTSDAYSIYIGTNLDVFDNNLNKNKTIKRTNKLILGYCGTLGSSYDITCVIDALDILNCKGVQTPKFLIMGDGPNKKKFEEYAKVKKIDCEFTGLLPYEKMCGMLGICDFVVNPITHGAAQSIINKHADYAAAGIPILNTQECEEYRQLIKYYNMGFNCKNNDPNDLATHMECLINNELLRIEMGRNARRCAEEIFNRRKSYNEIIKIIEQ